jgi:hypothetical protein
MAGFDSAATEQYLFTIYWDATNYVAWILIMNTIAGFTHMAFT